MAKKRTPRATKPEVLLYPVFNPSQMLAAGMSAVVSDVNGMPWVIDPNSGTAQALGVIYKTGADHRRK